jgi:cytochrome c oxidase cbb3-type subunit 4
MYTDILRRIAGIEVFPVVSLLLFVIVFTVALIWTLRLDPERVGRLSRLPLDPAPDDDELPFDRLALDRPRSRS